MKGKGRSHGHFSQGSPTPATQNRPKSVTPAKVVYTTQMGAQDAKQLTQTQQKTPRQLQAKRSGVPQNSQQSHPGLTYAPHLYHPQPSASIKQPQIKAGAPVQYLKAEHISIDSLTSS